MSRGAIYSAFAVVLAAVAGIAYTLIVGNQPLLGLDLQGGVSVVLEPTSANGDDVTDESLDLTVELLRGRIDEIGVAEPEISRQGNNIVVALPGVVEDQEEALDRLQQTAELRFRPVLVDLGPDLSSLIAESGDGDITLTDADGNPIDLEDSGITVDTDDSGTDESGTDESGAEGDEDSMAGQAGRFSPAVPAQDSGDGDGTDGTDDTEGTETGDTTDPATTEEDADTPAVDPSAAGAASTLTPAQLEAIDACSIAGVTPQRRRSRRRLCRPRRPER